MTDNASTYLNFFLAAFTAAHSDLIQNQIELTSAIESVLAEAASDRASTNQITEAGEVLEAFNAKVNPLAKRLACHHSDAYDYPDQHH